jgi:hypothetical protein
MDNILSFVVIAIGIIIMYGVFIHKKAGTQPGEDALNKLLDLLAKKEQTSAVQAAVVNKVVTSMIAAPVPAAIPQTSAPLPTTPAPSGAPAVPVAAPAVPASPTPKPPEVTVMSATKHPESNTPDPSRWPDMDPSGVYPLIYAIGMGGNPDSRFAPRLKYGAQTFADVAEVLDFKVRSSARDLALSQLDAEVDVKGKGFPEMADNVVAATLVDFDGAANDAIRWFNLSMPEHYALQNRGMTRLSINQLINQYSSGAPPEGWAGSACQLRRG